MPGRLIDKRISGPRRRKAGDDTSRDLRVLVASHGHPRFSKGGAENAAYMLHKGLNSRPGCQSWFLGCKREDALNRLGSRITQPFEDRDFVYSVNSFEWFHFANRDIEFPSSFLNLLAETRPNVVHFHHYAHFGVEAIDLVRRNYPDCKIVLTLHEMLAICNHYGQMVTVGDFNLCYRANLADCHRCFPSIEPSDFFLRKRYIQRFLNLVDVFIVPSKFVAGRYIDWGIPPKLLEVIENVVDPAIFQTTPATSDASLPLRIGFFGQISKLKGIDVFLDAAEALYKDELCNVTFKVFGDYRGQPPDFQAEFLNRKARAAFNVQFYGSYDSSQVDLLMQSVDVVVLPSIWWENSPVVIQEAFRNRRPVVCSDIGGMAEKVKHGVCGLHFPVGSAIDLAQVLKTLDGDREYLAKLSAGVSSLGVVDSMLDQHIWLYESLHTEGQARRKSPCPF